MQVKFIDTDRPRQLSLNAFDCYANTMCNRFQGCKDGEGFISVWNEHIDQFLDKNTGRFQNAEMDSSVTVESTSASVTEAGKKRKPISTPGSLLPASKVARTEQLSQVECTKEEEMDLKIQRHFLGI